MTESQENKIAIIGYGPLGEAFALCLKDSGFEISIGLRDNSKNATKASDAGFPVLNIADAVSKVDIVFLLIPDDVHGDVFNQHISHNIRKGSILVLAHGYSFLYGKIEVPDGIDAVVIAPHGPGKALRELYFAGKGLAAEIAIHRDSSGKAKERALDIAKALGFDKGGIRMTSVADEVVMDNFSEQLVLCGGVVELMRAAYGTLIDAGYDSESAYESVVRELKYTVDIIHESGPDGLYNLVSRSALIGSILNGKSAVGDDVHDRMKKVLEDIRSGKFHREFERLARSGLETDFQKEIERLKKDFKR